MKTLVKAIIFAFALSLALGVSTYASAKSSGSSSSGDYSNKTYSYDGKDFTPLPSGLDGEWWITDTKYPAKDLNKRNFTYSLNYKYGYDTTDIDNDVLSTQFDAGNRLTLLNVERVQKKYNCTFTSLVTPWDDLDYMFTTSVMAGQPYADLMGIWLRRIAM